MNKLLQTIGLKLEKNHSSGKIRTEFGLRLSIIWPQMSYEEYQCFFPKESIEEKRFYNIGSGGNNSFGIGFSHLFWLNLDYMHPIAGWNKTYGPAKDIVYDMLSLEPLPFQLNTV